MSNYDEKKLEKAIEKYKQSLNGLCFSAPEQEWIHSLTGEESILDIIEMLMFFNIEMNSIFEHCSECIYITDKNGLTLRVNKAFEEATGFKRINVMGRNVLDLEEEGLFRPSVYGIVIKEGRKISFLQEGKNWTAIATGTPIYDDSGNIYRVVSNARLLSEIKEITSYMEKSLICEEEKNEQIIAQSGKMKNILKIAKQVANVNSNVLLSGESGVGKNILARYIHQNSERGKGAFVEISCGAIPETLMESELFGYESGAFTGADKKGKLGLIELADKGTLFLDEIGELPLILQVKLLNFLQSRTITKIGGTKAIPVDVRIIAATNKDLSTMVSEGTFRNDLFYRLNVVPIFIPPLRERREDIYPAANYFAQKFRGKYNKEFELSDGFLETLLHSDWMGNMRELENYMERMVVMSDEEASMNLFDRRNDNTSNNSNVNHLTLYEKLEMYESELVRAAYKNNPNSYKLAQALGISQPSASRKINKYIKM